jgi:THO complex subunit 1
LDFLLSLSAKAKEKLSKAKLPDNPNKSVMYADQFLSEDDVSTPYFAYSPIHVSAISMDLPPHISCAIFAN